MQLIFGTLLIVGLDAVQVALDQLASGQLARLVAGVDLADGGLHDLERRAALTMTEWRPQSRHHHKQPDSSHFQWCSPTLAV